MCFSTKPPIAPINHEDNIVSHENTKIIFDFNFARCRRISQKPKHSTISPQNRAKILIHTEIPYSFTAISPPFFKNGPSKYWSGPGILSVALLHCELHCNNKKKGVSSRRPDLGPSPAETSPGISLFSHFPFIFLSCTKIMLLVNLLKACVALH